MSSEKKIYEHINPAESQDYFIHYPHGKISATFCYRNCKKIQLTIFILFYSFFTLILILLINLFNVIFQSKFNVILMNLVQSVLYDFFSE